MPLDQPPTGSDWIAPDCAGMDFYTADHGLRDLLALYVPAEVRATLEPHFAAARRAGRRPARRAGPHRRQASAGAAPARPLRPRRGLDRLPSLLSRDGARSRSAISSFTP